MTTLTDVTRAGVVGVVGEGRGLEFVDSARLAKPAVGPREPGVASARGRGRAS